MLPDRARLMSSCDDRSPLARPAPTERIRPSRSACPSWCQRPGCSGDHESQATYLAAEADAARVWARLLALDGASANGVPLVLVSVGVEQLELLDKPAVELLPHEARRLASSLLRLADLAERPEESVPAGRRGTALPTSARRREPLTSA